MRPFPRLRQSHSQGQTVPAGTGAPSGRAAPVTEGSRLIPRTPHSLSDQAPSPAPPQVSLGRALVSFHQAICSRHSNTETARAEQGPPRKERLGLHPLTVRTRESRVLPADSWAPAVSAHPAAPSPCPLSCEGGQPTASPLRSHPELNLHPDLHPDLQSRPALPAPGVSHNTRAGLAASCPGMDPRCRAQEHPGEERSS